MILEMVWSWLDPTIERKEVRLNRVKVSLLVRGEVVVSRGLVY